VRSASNINIKRQAQIIKNRRNLERGSRRNKYKLKKIANVKQNKKYEYAMMKFGIKKNHGGLKTGKYEIADKI
jgi:hypothetical protein